jgi:hypothetical protein
MYQGSFMIFQKPQDSYYGNVFSLAWMARMCLPQNRITFNWTEDYAFTWAETGLLVPGVNFMASQMMNANPNNLNSIRLDYNSYFFFEDPNSGGQPGTLTVQESASIPMNQAAVGIALSGSTAYVVQAQPNMNQVFTPHPNYWITFGNYRQGEVLDAYQISNATALNFPAGVNNLNVTLNPDGTFSVHS